MVPTPTPTPRPGPLASRAWPSRRLQDWFDHRARHRFEWPDWSDMWPDLESAQLKVEEFRDGDELVVRAEIPGIDPDRDVELTVADHTLRLRAERREESESETKQGYRSEFSYGAYTRVVPLPAGATEADVQATYVDGILEVRIPIDTEQAQEHKIPISRT